MSTPQADNAETRSELGELLHEFKNLESTCREYFSAVDQLDSKLDRIEGRIIKLQKEKDSVSLTELVKSGVNKLCPWL